MQVEGFIQAFYIFRGKKLHENYIQNYKLNKRMVMQKKAWMISTLFKDYFFCKKLVPMGISQSNCHLLIVDGHGSHVSLEAIKHAQEFGLICLHCLTTPFLLYNHWMYHVSSHSRRC
jgi:uncharacterized membrane protein YbaN (DUF454 family)